MKFEGRNQIKANSVLHVTRSCVDRWLLPVRRHGRSLSGDVYMDLIALLVQILSSLVAVTIRAVRSKTEK